MASCTPRVLGRAHMHADVAGRARPTLLAYRSGPAPGVKMMVKSVPLVKAPLSFAINLSSTLGSLTVSSMVSHMMLAKPCSLLMSHLRLKSSSRSPGQATGMS